MICRPMTLKMFQSNFYNLPNDERSGMQPQTLRSRSRVQDEDRRRGGSFARVIFLVWPFGSLAFTAYHLRSSWAKNIVWLFVIFFGLTFVISNPKIDANRYNDKLQEMGDHDYTFQTLGHQLYRDTEYVDVLQPLLTFVVSRFTSDYRVLFAAFGLIFGYFYSRNIWYLIDRTSGRFKWYGVTLLIIFTVINGFWNINGFRFWTAAHIFVFGVLHYLETGKAKHLFLTILTVFVHFSFFFPVLVFLLYLAGGNRKHLYFYFFLLTFTFSEASLTQVREYLSFLPSIFEAKVSNYTSDVYEQVLNERKSLLNWYVQYYGAALRYVVLVWLAWIYFQGGAFIREHALAGKLFSFVLLLYALSNLGSLIPSGNRFIVLSNLFAVALIFWYYHSNRQPGWINRIAVLSMPALALYFLISVRIGLDMMGVQMLVGNPVTAIFFRDETPLVDWIR